MNLAFIMVNKIIYLPTNTCIHDIYKRMRCRMKSKYGVTSLQMKYAKEIKRKLHYVDSIIQFVNVSDRSSDFELLDAIKLECLFVAIL